MQESAAASLVVRDAGGAIIYQGGYGSLAENAADTSLFFWSATGAFAPYLGWSVAVGEVGEPEASGPGEFHPVTLRLDGPAEIVAKVAQVHFAGQALPIVAREAEYYAADPQHPERPAVFMSLPIPAVEVPTVPPDEPESSAPDPDWELEEDVPDEVVDAVEGELTAERSILTEVDADELIQRVTALASTTAKDFGSGDYYKGFVTGFFDNPWSTGKDAVSSICGLVPKAINVATLFNPIRVVWEFTGGDRYAGEIAAAKKAVRAGKAAVEIIREFAPETVEFLWELNLQEGEALGQWLATGEFPGQEEMGPELKLALETVITLLILGDDAWQGMEAYERGYYQGYVAFEVAIVVISAVLSAEAGGTGALAVLSRHGPKLVKVLKYVEKILAKLEDVPALGRVLVRVRSWMVTAGKLPAFCFVKGTPVLTSKGMKPVEQVQAMDWVWSRSEDGCEWGWRPVLGTVVTHPDALAHVSYRALGGANGVRGPPEGAGIHAFPAGMLAGVPESGEISGSLEHPFYVQRKAEGFAGFVPLREMRAGDVLTLADGREAEVTQHRVEQAGPGRVFTTYNFEVAEHHTYFAGSLPVWVHNKGERACDKLTSKLVDIISRRGDDVSKYFEYLVEARDELDPRAGQLLDRILPDRFWSNASNKISDTMLNAVNNGEIPWNKVPSVKAWNEQFFKRPPGYQHGTYPFPEGMLPRSGVHVHHLVEKWIQNKLSIGGDPDLVPGVVMPGAGVAGHGQLAGKLKSAILNLTDEQDIVDALRAVYDSKPEWGVLWPTAREWLKSHPHLSGLNYAN